MGLTLDALTKAVIRGRTGNRAATITPKRQPLVLTPKIGRNAPCPCQSGRKFKKCCGG